MHGELKNAGLTIPLGKKVAYSVSQIGVNLLWQAFNTVAVYYYVSVLNVSATLISGGMIVYGIVNAFLNILAGHLSDRTTSRMGRRIPYIAFGTLPYAILFYLLFHPFVRGSGALLVYFFIITLLFDLCFTFVALNVGALFPEMYQTVKDRSSVSALQQLFGIFGLIIGVALSKSLGQSLGWSTMALLFGVITAVSLYISLIGSFENPKYRDNPLHFRTAISETLKNRRFVVYVLASLFIQLTTTMLVTVSSFYSKYVVPLSSLQSSLFLGLIFIVAIPISFIWARVTVKSSSIDAVLMASLCFAVVSILFWFANSPGMAIGGGALLGIGVSGFMVLLNILLAEVIDYDAKLTGKRREGMYLGMNGFIVRIGMSLQYAIMGIFFAVTKFQASATTQPANTIRGFRFLISGLPILLLLIAAIFLFRYRKYVRAERPAAAPGER